MRNNLQVLDAADLIFCSVGDLDGSEVTVQADDPNLVSIHVGPVAVFLSPESALELGAHLMVAAKAALKEKGDA